ncbi:fimbrillin family protein [Sphingobacterium siyangense]|uniref:fimbrillin family protein n=1 Tax=Sphingobacterium siyangense TaxID=459529 RepID=UPI00200EE7F2|nr:fimbrillin family protein [Sphingobacterium siyangense]UQA73953.1 fimbrillin family protein [Sphingobacterium siyangense]
MKKYSMKTLLCFSVIGFLLVTSCQKGKEDNTATEKASITLKMNGIGLDDGSSTVAKASTSNTAAASSVQSFSVPFNDDLVVRATLSEDSNLSASGLRASAKAATGVGAITAFNGDYTVRVYKQGNSTLLTTVNCTGGASNKFELEPGAYKFIVSSYGNPSATGADKDPLWQEINQTITSGSNVLDIVLKHKLTQVTVKFDAGSGRTISAIGGGTIEPNFANYTFDEVSGVVTFAGASSTKSLTFPTLASAQVWTSNPTMIAVGTTTVGKVRLDPVTINSITGNVELTGLSLKQGVQYTLELNLGPKKLPTFNIGNEIWSGGNLERNPSTGEYSFGSEVNSPGDYWFPDRLLPKRLDGTNQNADGTNGGNGDPCALVLPAATWRLPTEVEVQTLIDRTDPKQQAGKGQDNPNLVAIWNPARYVDYYNGTSATTRGMFFGVKTDEPVNFPVSERDKYLFFAYRGYYPNDNIGNVIGSEGAYLVTATAGGYKTLHMTGAAKDIGYGIGWRAASSTEAVQIRCVKK